MRKLSQTEELAEILASRARHHLLTPEQVSRAMEERSTMSPGWTRCMRRWRPAASGWRKRTPTSRCWTMPRSADWNMTSAEGVALDDPVKAYLKEIGQVPLLSAKRNRRWPVLPEQGMRTPADVSARRICGWWSRWPSATRAGAALPRPHPGGQPRPDEGSGEV